MWTTTIESKVFNKGFINVGVIFSNGEDKFTDLFTVRSSSDLDRVISNRLNELSSLDIDQINIGQYQTLVKPVPVITNKDNFVSALRTVQSVKRGIDLGIIDPNDKVVTDAVANAKDLFDPIFVDVL